VEEASWGRVEETSWGRVEETSLMVQPLKEASLVALDAGGRLEETMESHRQQAALE
jgi:hypothetical protein